MAANKQGKEIITSYKAFNADLTCTGGAQPFQYEIGKSYEMDGEIKACDRGFHACEYPLDVLSYYPPAGSRFAIVEQSGKIDRESSDSKLASSKIKIKAELNLSGLIKAAIEHTFSRSKPEGETATGNRGAASATGYRGAASATGDQGAASATGNRGAASATGDRGAASATGDRGAASATGDWGAASATGDWGAASATGNWGAASATGRHGIAVAAGIKSRAMGAKGCALFLVYRDADADGDGYGRIIHAKAAIVGEHGIKPDTWYSLNAEGEFIEI